MNKDSFSAISTFHQDLINDISFDWYGQRLATCSTDRTLKIWQKSQFGKWDPLVSDTDSQGPIKKVIWAHPEFGNILATLSMDRSINLYEEKKDFINNQKNAGDPQLQQTSWKKTPFLDEKEDICDMKFGPKHLGLILAIARADGKIKIFKFSDLINLNARQTLCEVNASPMGINSISWNKNRFEQAMIAVGCKDKETSIMKNNSSHLIQNSNIEEEKQGSCFRIFSFKTKDSTSYQETLMKLDSQELNTAIVHNQAVNDVSWSLINGRSFNLIGTCGKEGARVWYIKATSQQQPESTLQVLKVIKLQEQIQQEPVEVWKISWNLMASLVATSDNNEITIYKSTGISKWEKIKSIKENQVQE